MTRRAWFCYELNFHNEPVPVIYYDEPPPKSSQAKENTPERSYITEISHMPTNVEGDYSFSLLQELYPHPKLSKQETSMLTKSSLDATAKPKEKQMARPVTGFITSQGQFFDNEEEANLYDASYELDRATTEAVKEAFGETRTSDEVKDISDGIKGFITANEKLIREYLDARRAALADSEESTTGLAGQTAGDNPPDDTRVRDEDNQQVVEDGPTKAKSSRSREKADASSLPGQDPDKSNM